MAPPRHNLADMLSLRTEEQGDTAKACNSVCACECVDCQCVSVFTLNTARAKRLILTDCPVKRARGGRESGGRKGEEGKG